MSLVSDFIQAKHARDERLGKYGRTAATPAPAVVPPPIVIPIRVDEKTSKLHDELDGIKQDLRALYQRAKAIEREIVLHEPSESPHIATIRQIIEAVANYYKRPLVDMYSNRRDAEVVKAKHVAMYLAKMLTKHSLTEIARRFGGRDHTTVLNAVNKTAKKIEEDSKLKHEVAEITAQIMGAGNVSVEP